MRYSLVRVVYDYGELKDWLVERAGDDEISEVASVYGYISTNDILERNRTARISETDNFVPLFRSFWYLLRNICRIISNKFLKKLSVPCSMFALAILLIYR